MNRHVSNLINQFPANSLIVVAAGAEHLYLTEAPDERVYLEPAAADETFVAWAGRLFDKARAEGSLVIIGRDHSPWPCGVPITCEKHLYRLADVVVVLRDTDHRTVFKSRPEKKLAAAVPSPCGPNLPDPFKPQRGDLFTTDDGRERVVVYETEARVDAIPYLEYVRNGKWGLCMAAHFPYWLASIPTMSPRGRITPAMAAEGGAPTKQEPP